MRFVFHGFILCFLCCFLSVSARAQLRAGAPRPLGVNGAFVMGTHAHFDNGELNFVRIEGARPQLWRAVLDDSDAKNAIWSTQARAEQSPYLLDVLASQRAFSPDGKTIAFVSQRGGQSAIFVVPVSDFGRSERTRRVAFQAQSPAWMDENTLLFESTDTARPGLFRVSVNGDEKTRAAPQLLFSRGGESAVSPDQQTICIAAKNDNSSTSENATQLYLLAADGSGARAIPQTEGARRPCFSPDGNALFYDAPGPGQSQVGSTPRMLWTVPLNAAPPTAQLFFVRENKIGDAEIIGTLFSGDAGELQSQIEFWRGEETEFATRPQFVLPIKNAPIHNAALVTWPMPQNAAPQEWTLRLSAQDAAGQSTQSTLTFLWPLAQKMQPFPVAPIPDAPIQPAPVFATTVKAVPVTSAPIPVAPVTPVFPSPATTSAPKVDGTQPPKNSTVLAALPDPALPGAPAIETGKLPPVPPPTNVSSRAGSTPSAARATVESPPVRRGLPKATPTKTPPQRPAPPKPQPKPQTKTAAKNSGGIPSQVSVGSSTSVEVSLTNTGTRSWSSKGDSPVRLLIRWVRPDTKIRYRWAVKWLRETVEPGQSTKVRFDLEAPTSPGRYVLTYALVRLNPQNYDGKSYKPPPAKSADQRWPGEFGAVSFDVVVK